MDTNINAIVTDAAGYAKGLLKAAGTAADSLLSTAANSAAQELPKIETDAFNVLIDFVPSAYRSAVQGFVSPLVNQVEQQFNGVLTADIAKGLVVAKTRIDAITGATG